YASENASESSDDEGKSQKQKKRRKTGCSSKKQMDFRTEVHNLRKKHPDLEKVAEDVVLNKKDKLWRRDHVTKVTGLDLEYWKRRSTVLEEELKAIKKKDKAKGKRVSNLGGRRGSRATMEKRKINLRDGPHKNNPFTLDVRACFMQLLSFDVSAQGADSGRSGGATFAFRAGVQVELIRLQGDWRSDAYLLLGGDMLNALLNISINGPPVSTRMHQVVPKTATPKRSGSSGRLLSAFARLAKPRGGFRPVPGYNIAPPGTFYLYSDEIKGAVRDAYGFVFAFLGYLVLKGIFEKVEVGYLLVGHTHEDVDQFFSKISSTLQRQDVATVEELIHAFNHSFPNVKTWELEAILDVKAFLGDVSNELEQHSSCQAFKFSKGLDGRITRKQANREVNAAPNQLPGIQTADHGSAKLTMGCNQKKEDVGMIQCQECQSWYHHKCMSVPESENWEKLPFQCCAKNKALVYESVPDITLLTNLSNEPNSKWKVHVKLDDVVSLRPIYRPTSGVVDFYGRPVHRIYYSGKKCKSVTPPGRICRAPERYADVVDLAATTWPSCHCEDTSSAGPVHRGRHADHLEHWLRKRAEATSIADFKKGLNGVLRIGSQQQKTTQLEQQRADLERWKDRALEAERDMATYTKGLEENTTSIRTPKAQKSAPKDPTRARENTAPANLPAPFSKTASVAYEIPDRHSRTTRVVREARGTAVPGSPVLAVTSTASKLHRRKIQTLLSMEGCIELVENPDRANIKLHVSHAPLTTTFDWLLQLERAHRKDAPCPICKSINDCSNIYEICVGHLNTEQMKLVEMYHAHTPENIKARIRENMAYSEGCIRVLLGTTAASMGINFAGVDNVVNFGPPQELEQVVYHRLPNDERIKAEFDLKEARKNARKSVAMIIALHNDMIELDADRNAKTTSVSQTKPTGSASTQLLAELLMSKSTKKTTATNIDMMVCKFSAGGSSRENVQKDVFDKLCSWMDDVEIHSCTVEIVGRLYPNMRLLASVLMVIPDSTADREVFQVDVAMGDKGCGSSGATVSKNKQRRRGGEQPQQLQPGLKPGGYAHDRGSCTALQSGRTTTNPT
ncbi:hypothetical protein Bbelb_050360, partial [Branchiostoma belcheri]